MTTSESPPALNSSGFWASDRHFELRGYLAPGLVLLAVWLPQSTPPVVWSGVVLLVGAAWLRLWAARYIGGAAHVHLESASKKRRLITEGPFAWCRNPLYVANALGAAGACLAVGPVWLGLAAFVIMLTWYSGVARWEESNLAGLYPDEYPAYRGSTPSLLPRPPANAPGPPPGGFYPLRRAMKRERGMLFGVVLVSLGALFSAGVLG